MTWGAIVASSASIVRAREEYTIEHAGGMNFIEAITEGIKLLPAGTKLELVGIKQMGLGGSAVYVKVEGYDDWVGVYFNEHSADFRLQYNREFFRKLEK
jgi:hypothetical protein